MDRGGHYFADIDMESKQETFNGNVPHPSHCLCPSRCNVLQDVHGGKGELLLIIHKFLKRGDI